jgi:hypothetical protein
VRISVDHRLDWGQGMDITAPGVEVSKLPLAPG